MSLVSHPISLASHTCVVWDLHIWEKRLENPCFDQLHKQTYDRNRVKGVIVWVWDMVSTQYNFVIPCNLRLSQNSNKHKKLNSYPLKSRERYKSYLPQWHSERQWERAYWWWDSRHRHHLYQAQVGQSWDLHYNPEIGLHNTKDISAHLDNPEGKRQLLWEAFFRQRHSFSFWQY